MQKANQKLSKREQQIMDIIYQINEASVQTVLEKLPDPPSYSAVRALMNIMVNNGFLKFRQSGSKYIYFPATSIQKAKKNAIKHLLNTYFQNSMEDAFATIVDIGKEKMNKQDFDRLTDIINKAREEAND